MNVKSLDIQSLLQRQMHGWKVKIRQVGDDFREFVGKSFSSSVNGVGYKRTEPNAGRVNMAASGVFLLGPVKSCGLEEECVTAAEMGKC